MCVADSFADGIRVQQISLRSKARADGNKDAGLAAKNMKKTEGEGEDPESWCIRESTEQRHCDFGQKAISCSHSGSRSNGVGNPHRCILRVSASQLGVVAHAINPSTGRQKQAGL